MSADQTESKLNNWVTEGIIIAILTVAAYLCAFFYELGYSNIFGIPAYFIELSTVKIFIPLSMILVFVYYLTIVLGSITWKPSSKKTAVEFTLIIILTAILLLVIITHIISRAERTITSLMIGALAGALLVLLFQKPTTATKVDLADITLISTIGRTKLPFIYKCSIYFFLIFIISFNVGRFVAASKMTFLVLDSSPQRVVLQKYENNLICAPFCRETKEVEMSFQIIKIGENSELSLKKEYVGPLRPVNKMSINKSK